MKQNNKLCECGCGGIPKEGNRFINGHNVRCSNPWTGKNHSGEKNPMFGKVGPNLGKKFSTDHAYALGNSRRGKTWDEIYGLEKSNKLKKDLKEFRLKQVFPFKDTSIEVCLQEGLTKQTISYKKHVCLPGQPDLFIEPGICVFADGDYWHANPILFNTTDILYSGKTASEIRENDRIITEKLQSMGYTVLRFWETDILNSIDTCIEQIKEQLEIKVNQKELIYA